MTGPQPLAGARAPARPGEGTPVDTAPFSLQGPAGEPIALVCDSPHSGTTYPPDFGHAVDRAALRRSEDTHVDTLWAGVPAAGGSLLCAHFPRSYIDANRDEHDIDPAMLDAPWPGRATPSARTLQLGVGLVWRATPEHLPIYARQLSVAELRQRIECYWRPYRQALARTLHACAARHGGYWHLNLHSMPSNVYERLGLPPRQAADVVLGDRQGSSCHADFTQAVAQSFRRQGLRVAVNDPYEGADLVREAGAPHAGRHSLQIEINRAIYMDEATREPHGGHAALKASIDAVLAEVRDFLLAHPLPRREEGRAGALP
jgi:N-formylglutamate deformylase